MKRFLLAVLTLCVVFSAGTPVVAQEVLEGIDLWVTDINSTNYDLSDLNLIAPGCFVIGDPIIPLKGIPQFTSPICPGNDLGGADTIIERLFPTVDLDIVPIQPVDIQIVELHLQSVQPFQVNCNAEEQSWMLDITIDPAQQPPGQMQIQKINPNGGVLDLTPLPVVPILTFTRVDVPPFVTVQETIQVFFNSPPIPWTYTPGPTSLEIPGCTSNFFPGVEPFIPRSAGRAHRASSPPFTVTLTGGDLTWTITPPATGPVSTEETTWGRIKALYNTNTE